jgi:uncharacterized protein YqjF (DUF2071 family)
MPQPFLTAEWRKLAMANYVVEPALLQPYLPAKTEIDLWNGQCFVSVVGFMFHNTRVKGIKIPFHVNFEEINLRFYVRYGEKRGVVFIKEIVSRPAISFVANKIYNENYETLPTYHSWIATPAVLNVEYRWKKVEWNFLRVSTEKTPVHIVPGSQEEFITENYWGYTKAGNDHAFEYEVQHPRWQIYPVRTYSLQVDFENIYGPAFGFLSKQKPASVLLAEGSAISVLKSQKI